MRRRKYFDRRSSDNHERWLVSYADFITLLFAFFVVMYAISSVNQGKYHVLSNALVTAFGDTPPSGSTQVVIQAPPKIVSEPLLLKKRANQRKQQEKMRNIANNMMKMLAPLVKEQKVRIMQGNRGIIIEINASVLFQSGQAIIADDSASILREVAMVLKDHEYSIQVEGHTDDIPVNSTQFPSNWELSTARASSVVRLFIDNGVNAAKLTAMGYGENQPVESNDSPEGRARNRRVAIAILSAETDSMMDAMHEMKVISPTQALPADNL